MNDRQILELAAGYFKTNHRKATPEAVVCFLVMVEAVTAPTIGDIARIVGLTEPDTYLHLSQLTAGMGAGLVQLENMGDGRSSVHLTDLGREARAELQRLFAAEA